MGHICNFLINFIMSLTHDREIFITSYFFCANILRMFVQRLWSYDLTALYKPIIIIIIYKLVRNRAAFYILCKNVYTINAQEQWCKFLMQVKSTSEPPHLLETSGEALFFSSLLLFPPFLSPSLPSSLFFSALSSPLDLPCHDAPPETQLGRLGERYHQTVVASKQFVGLIYLIYTLIIITVKQFYSR